MRIVNAHKKNRRICIAFAVIVLTLLSGCKENYEWTVSNTPIVVETTIEVVPNQDDLLHLQDDNSNETKTYNKDVLLEKLNEDMRDYRGMIDDEHKVQEKVDLIFFMGQSNMAGHGGNASKAPYVPEKAGLEYRVISDPEILHPIEEPFGRYENKEGGLYEGEEKKKGSLVSSFVNTYYELTGHKVVAVSASVGGMAMDLWLADGIIEDSVSRINSAVAYLDEHNYDIEHVFVVWLQGESDGARNVPPETYKEYFYEYMNNILATSVERVFLITPGRIYYDANAFNEIIKVQQEICENDENFVLATSIMSEIPIEDMSDAYHYNQNALNLIGEEAAKGVAEYIQEPVQ